MKFSEYFKKARLAANLTQAKIAFHLGYRSSQFVSNWERGISLPPNDEILRLAAYMNADPVEMVDLAMAEKKYNTHRLEKTRLKRRANSMKERNGQE